MTKTDHEPLEQIMRAERGWVLANPPAPPKPVEPESVHFSELPEPVPGSHGAADWNRYRREVARLLADGHEGRWVLIANEQIIGIWDTETEASAVAAERYFMQPVLVHRVLVREPVLRGGGYNRQWR